MYTSLITGYLVLAANDIISAANQPRNEKAVTVSTANIIFILISVPSWIS
jgi:hypothetical protein